jgi:hypothetical protein
MGLPTHEDAELMIQIAQWGTSLGTDEAIARVFAEDFDPATADAMADDAVRKLLIFGESIGTLTKHGLLNTQLVHDWIWIDGLWSRLSPAALAMRESQGEPRLWENFEALAAF